MNENWRSIPGRADYEVSDLGRVRSVDRTIARMTKRGPVLARMKGRVLKPINGGDGYAMVDLGAADRRYVHTLVLEAHICPRPVGQQAAHGDGDKRNNAVGNLRWATRLENEADKVRHGTRLSGTRTLNGRKTTCCRGHPYDDSNTKRNRGRRYCRTCQRDQKRQARAAKGLRLMSEGVPAGRAAEIAKVGRNTLGRARCSGADR